MDETRVALAGLISLLAAYSLVPVAVVLAHRAGFLDHPVGWKQHGRSTPLLGGVAVVLSVALGAFLVAGNSELLIALAGGATFLLAVGTADDRRHVPVLARIGAVLATGAMLSWVGFGWEVFESDLLNLLLSVAWCLGVVNAVNLIDLMDGVAGAIAATSAAGIVVLSVALGDEVQAVAAAALCGSCLGFLRYNVSSPARIFLGDGGSMSIGLMLAGITMSLSFDADLGALSLATGIMLVGVPIFDMTLRIVSRVRRHARLATATPDSIANWLRAAFSSPRVPTLVLAGAQGIVCVLAVWATLAGEGTLQGAAALLFALGLTLIWGLLASDFPAGGPRFKRAPAPVPPARKVRSRRERVLRRLPRASGRPR